MTLASENEVEIKYRIMKMMRDQRPDIGVRVVEISAKTAVDKGTVGAYVVDLYHSGYLTRIRYIGPNAQRMGHFLYFTDEQRFAKFVKKLSESPVRMDKERASAQMKLDYLHKLQRGGIHSVSLQDPVLASIIHDYEAAIK